jgi:ADP-ribose pyrophosphatase YjhB (NUDIX family)
MVIRPGVSAVIVESGKVLLQRRDDNGRWGLPGGAVEPGESLREAIAREVREETGLEVEPVRVIGVYSSPALHQVMSYPDGNVIHYVSTSLACVITGGMLVPGAESLELAWFAPDALPDDVMPIARIRIEDAVADRVEAFLR